MQEAADQIATTGRPAPRAGLALLFLVQEARRPESGAQVGGRLEQRAADAEESKNV